MGGGDGGSRGREERFLKGDGPELRPIRDQAWSFQDHSYLAVGLLHLTLHSPAEDFSLPAFLLPLFSLPAQQETPSLFHFVPLCLSFGYSQDSVARCSVLIVGLEP